MERKDFLKTCGFACLTGTLLSTLVEGCSTSRTITGTFDKTGLLVPINSFEQGKNNYRKYIIVQHDQLKYPVCVYRLGPDQYTALLMRCTHQGAELQVFGDKLECPAHGSQFNNRGTVLTGPADTNLRKFPVQIQQDQLHITLS